MNVDKLDKFTRQYIETALWSSLDDNDEPLDRNYSIEDIDPETLTKMIEDCKKFQEANSMHYSDSGQAGHDFWLTRCRHGAGYWDGDYPEPQATILTNASHDFGECDIYVGDNGKIYI